MTDETPSPITPFLEALDSMKMILDMLAGFQAECISRGYTPDEARQMAVDFHYMMCHNAGNSKDES